MFRETMMGGEAVPPKQETHALDPKILEINDKITKAEDFIKDLEEFQIKSPTEQRQKDIITAKIDLAEYQTEKQHLLDEKFMGTPSNEELIARAEQAANDSQIDPIMSGTNERYTSDRLDGDAGKRLAA
jgi:hypothetical protein